MRENPKVHQYQFCSLEVSTKFNMMFEKLQALKPAIVRAPKTQTN